MVAAMNFEKIFLFFILTTLVIELGIIAAKECCNGEHDESEPLEQIGAAVTIYENENRVSTHPELPIPLEDFHWCMGQKGSLHLFDNETGKPLVINIVAGQDFPRNMHLYTTVKAMNGFSNAH